MAGEKKTRPELEEVEIQLFKDDDKYKDDVFVSVNGRTFQIQRGEKVKVPKFVADILEKSERQDKEAARRLEALVADYKKKEQQ